jgi:anti-sigma B factor antagonist
MPHVPNLDLTRRPDGDGRDILRVAGDVDLATAPRLVRAAEEWLDSGSPGPVRLDLSEVTFLDSTGIGALLSIRNAATAAGTRVEVLERSSAVERVLSLAGVAELFVVGHDA